MTLIDKPNLAPGEESYAQLRLTQPLCIFRGDRFVIRGEAPPYTIGGGIVLDIMPSKIKRKDREKAADWLETLEKASPEDAAHAFLSQSATGARLRDIAVRTGETIDTVQALMQKGLKAGNILSVDIGDDIFLISSENFNGLRQMLTEELKGFFESQPHRLFMPREELRSRVGGSLPPQLFERVINELLEGGKIDATQDGLSLSGRKAKISGEQQAAKEKMENIFREAAYSPPTFSQAEQELEDPKSAKQMTSLLIEEGTLQKISPTIAYHKEHLEAAISKIRNHFENSDKLGVGDLKDLLGVSRKHAVPLLEYADRIGLTTRVGDHRVLKKKPQN
jgi:selenocysteine-specific elongation factor